MKYVLIISGFFAMLCCTDPTAKNNMGHKIAVANGIENFKKVKMLEFTFNVQRDTLPPSSRHWQWYPQTNEAVLLTDSGNIRFKRTDTSTKELKKLNARFTNDEYWLLYPLHLSWDKGFEMRDSTMRMAQISGKKMRKIAAK